MTPDDIADALGVARLLPDEQELLLDLARDVAHASERKFAPLSCFLVGAALDGDDRLATLQRLAAQVRSSLA